MPRSDPFHGFGHQAWLIGLVLVTGCAQSKTDLQDTLARRVMPDEVTSGQSTSQGEGKGDRATTDANVRPAAAAATRSRSSGPLRGRIRPTAIPPAIVEPPRRANSDQSSPAPSLPSDSDEATLEAIAASGKPLTVSEAIDMAFRFQPRLRAQLETIDQARGLQQIAFSAFLPTLAGPLRRGWIQPRSAEVIPVQVGKSPGFNFIPGLGTVPDRHSTSGRPSSWLSSRSSGCSSTSAVGWAVYEQARLASDIARLQTDRAFQTVANEVAIAYYNVLRSQALRRTAQDALRRAEEQLADARKLEREGVVEREIVLRSEVQQGGEPSAAPRRHGGGVRGPGGAEPGHRAEMQSAGPRRRAGGGPAAGHIALRLLADGHPGATRVRGRPPHGADRRGRGPALPEPTSRPKSSRMEPC